MPMKNPPHPGLSMRHDCLEPLGLSVTEAARKLGVSRKQLSDIVNCRSGISPEMAIRLDKAFGGGADTWYRLQSTWELAQALKKADHIKVERLSPAGCRARNGRAIDAGLESPVREPAHLARPAGRGSSMNSINFKAGFGGIKWDKWDS